MMYVWHITTGGRRGVEYRAFALQKYWNRVGNAGGWRGDKRIPDSSTKASKQSTILLKVLCSY